MIDFFRKLFGREQRTKYTYPKELNAMVQAALKLHRDWLKQAGIRFSEKKGSVTIRMRPGERNNRNGWSWHDPANREQVMGLTHGSGGRHTVEIAHQPGDIGKGWNVATLAHELCHTTLEREHGIYGHDPRLKGIAFGWH